MRRQHSKAARRPAHISRRGFSTTSFNTRSLRFEPLEDRRLLAVISVDNLNDSGAGSLRAAIDATNLTAGIPDEITFSVTGTINIASQLPTITDALTITGPGANLLTINAGNGTDHLPATLDGYRIFDIDNGSDLLINVAISGLTLTGGDTGIGGAILNRENLTLTASTVSGNAAIDSGGIANFLGTATVADSTISDNRAGVPNFALGDGGGIGNFGGTLVLTNSTVSGNQAGYGNSRTGGGVNNLAGGTVTISDSTISGNSAGSGGGIASDFGTLTITGSTITGNSAGIGSAGIFIDDNSTTATITGSVIAGNSAPANSEIGNFGTVNLNGFNLIGDSSKTTAQALFGVTAGGSDILATSNGTTPTALAAILAPLANNGGPTRTHALVPGSPAINAIPIVNLARGGVATQSSEYEFVSLPAGNAIDGNPSTFTSTALEDANATWQVTRASDFVVTQVVLHNRLQNQSRFRDITVEVLNASGVVVATSALLNPENILGGGQLDVGPATLSFDLVSETGGTVVGRTIRVRRTPDPDLSGSGGGGNEGEPNVLSLGEVEVLGVAGAAATDQRGTQFERNFGSAMDIGAYEAQSLALVVDTLADESDGDYSTGDLSLREALELANANPGADTVSFDAGLAGGTINLNAGLGQLVISQSATVTGLGANLLKINAGGNSRVLHITGGTVGVSGLTLTGGNASQGGGLLSEAAATTTITAMAIEGNTATSATNAGGGIWAAGILNVFASTISSNTAPSGRGGGIHATGITAIASSTISGNSAGGHGGGLIHMGLSTVSIFQSTITGNTAGGSGGGVYKAGGIATITGSIISGNTAVTSSREIYKSPTSTGVNLTGYNLIGDSSETTVQALGFVSSTASTILATSNGTNPTALSAIIAPLANNGGPTKTHALVAGSPAQDTGDPGALTNVTLGGVASQSSTYNIGGTYPASNAIDGSASTFTHTALEDTSATWQVTLMGDFAVYEVVLHNRATNPSRLRDITIEVLNSSGVVVATSALLNPENILGGGVLSTGPATLTFDLVAATGGPVVGHTIRVRRTADPDLSGVGGSGDDADRNVLSLAEVEVQGVIAATTEQRGADYERLVNGRIDIGAYEVQAPSADFDGDGDVDGRDFLLWQRGFGTPAPTAIKSQGDADNDLDVDGADLGVWRLAYGTVPGPLVAALAVEDSVVNYQDAVDAAMAFSLLDDEVANGETDPENEPVAQQQSAADAAFADDTVIAQRQAVATVEFSLSDSKDEDAADAWLAEELLERVFG
jgi:CSLREA domain-containing protein